MHAKKKPVAAFDNKGMIFAAGLESALVALYDVREFEKVRLELEGTDYSMGLLWVHNFFSPLFFCRDPFLLFRLCKDTLIVHGQVDIGEYYLVLQSTKPFVIRTVFFAR